MLRQTLKTEAIHQLVDTCFRTVSQRSGDQRAKGAVPSQYQSVARYVAKYVVSPPIAVRRIDRYDGERVTYHYRSHRTDRMEHETVPMSPRLLAGWCNTRCPKGSSVSGITGCRPRRRLPRCKVVIQAALAKVEGVVKGAVQDHRPADLPATV